MAETLPRKVFAYHGSHQDELKILPHQGQEGGISLSAGEDVAACYGPNVHQFNVSKCLLYTMEIKDWLADTNPTREIKDKGFDGIRVTADRSYGIGGGSEPEDRTFHKDMVVVWNTDKLIHTRLTKLEQAHDFESLPPAKAPTSCRLSASQFTSLARVNLPKEEFHEWMSDLYENEGERGDVLANEALRLDSYYDFLKEKHSLQVREDGQWEIYHLTPEVESILGPEARVVMYHMTSDAVLPDIAPTGLRSTGKDVNRQGEGEEGVFLSSIGSGPAMEGYGRAAERAHGGTSALLEVEVRLGDLRSDPHDEDIRSGRTQFVVPYVPPAHILNLAELNESDLPDIPSVPKVALGVETSPVRGGHTI